MKLKVYGTVKEHRENWKGKYKAVIRIKGQFKSTRPWSPKKPCKGKYIESYTKKAEGKELSKRIIKRIEEQEWIKMEKVEYA